MPLSTKILAVAVLINWALTFYYWNWLSSMSAKAKRSEIRTLNLRNTNFTMISAKRNLSPQHQSRPVAATPQPKSAPKSSKKKPQQVDVSSANSSTGFQWRQDSQIRWYVYDMPQRFVTLAHREVIVDYSIFAAEKTLADELRSRSVQRPEDANLFYVPVFASAFLSGQKENVNFLERQASPTVRGEARQLVLDAIRWVQDNFPYWKRSGGADHVMLFSHENGPCLDLSAERALRSDLTKKLLHALRNVIVLSHTGDLRSGCYDPSHSIVIPPWVADQRAAAALSLGFSTAELSNARRDRLTFMYFRDRTTIHSTTDDWQAIRLLYGKNGTAENEGQVPRLEPCIDNRAIQSAASCERDRDPCKECELSRRRVFSRGVRQMLTVYLPEFAKTCQTCSDHRVIFSDKLDRTATERIAEMAEATFCVSTRGFADWNVRTFEALQAGCIPVIVSDDAHLPFQGSSVDWSKISVRVREAFAQNVYEKISRFSHEQILTFRRAIRERLPDLLYPTQKNPGTLIHRLEASLTHLLARRQAGGPLPQALLPAPTKPYPAAIAAKKAEPSDDEICLAIQMTVDRIGMLALIARHWKGAVFAVLLVKKGDDVSDIQRRRRDLLAKAKEHDPASAAKLHVELYRAPADWTYYPVNALRNLALQGCAELATLVMTIDVDFVPAVDAYKRLTAHAAAMLQPDGPRRALVVPAFEASDEMVANSQSREAMLRSKDKIVEHYRFDDRYRARQTKRTKSLAWPFDQKRSTTGHRATNSEYWMRSTSPYKVDYKWGWEPYLLLRTPVPRYDEAFVQYGQNKVMYAYELLAAGFEFVVVPDAWLLHSHVDPNKKDTAERPKLFQIGWSCWADFVVRVQDTYDGFRYPTPCWAAQFVYPEVNIMYKDSCVKNPKGNLWRIQ